jgi:hypothetical protein
VRTVAAPIRTASSARSRAQGGTPPHGIPVMEYLTDNKIPAARS